MKRAAVYSAFLAAGLAISCAPPPGNEGTRAPVIEARSPLPHVTETWSLPAFVDADPTRDRARIEACLSKAQSEQADAALCIDVVSRPCLQLDSNLSTAGMVGCASREGEVWETLLNARLANVEASAAPVFLQTLRSATTTWRRSTDESCALFAAFHEGGTIAAPMEAGCMAEATARRYLFLAAFEPPNE